MTITIPLTDYQKETAQDIENGLKEIGIKKFKLGSLCLSSVDILEVCVTNSTDFLSAKDWISKSTYKIKMQKMPEEGNSAGYLYVALDKNAKRSS